MPSNGLGMAQDFAETRLRQVARLAALQREYVEEFNDLGHIMTQLAIFTMVMDCRMAGVDQAAIDTVLTGETPPP